MDNKLKIINYLGKNIGNKYTMHELSKLVKIPYATFHRTIANSSDVIFKNKFGNTCLVEIKISNPIIKSYLTISSDEEKKKFLRNHRLIRKISNELQIKDIVLLFGSYAKGTQTKNSDIDLLIINNSGKKSISFSRYELLFKKKINPIFITKKEFKLMLKDKEENVGKQALKNHIVLKNPDKFWSLVENGV